MPKRNPVTYMINTQTYTLSPIPEQHQWPIDRYLPYKGAPLDEMRDMDATHHVTTITPAGITLVLGYFSYKPPMTGVENAGEWLAYTDDGQYILCQPKLLLAFAALCEMLHNGNAMSCSVCHTMVHRDEHGTLVDNTGGDVCTERGNDSPHITNA